MRTYIAIDLKSFYASVECVARNLNPLTTNLLVADASRTDKTICLAVSPSLKSYGIGGRARLFEARQRIKEVNQERLEKSPYHMLTKESFRDEELKEHPDWAVSYIVAPPRMALYMETSAQINSIYMKYISAEDIHIYSVDEVFIDATDYLKIYKKTAHELAEMLIKEVLHETGVTATAGIGTNLYLCKVAMDIVAKHIPADRDGVRIAELDERSYREKLWDHKPLTSFWQIGKGVAERLAPYGIDTMGKLARMSEQNEERLYKMFGVHAEVLIDHAWGWEPCTMKEIKSYKPSTHSVSRGQVLTCPYDFQKTRVVMREMVDAICLTLASKQLETKKLTIHVSYDRECLSNPEIAEKYTGIIAYDFYGRPVPKHAQGTARLKEYTTLENEIAEVVMQTFDQVVNPDLLIRRLNISADEVRIKGQHHESKKKVPTQLDLFSKLESQEEENKDKEEKKEKEKKVQETLLNIKTKYGANAILKGLNFSEGATAIERNKQIGGHKA